MTYHVDLYVDVGVDAVQVEYTVQSATDYYPYGKALRSFGKERYQSTYHERDVESGFDYRGARFYDSDVARFNSLDPLAAEFASWSPYNYVAGNPLYYTDPDGRNPRVAKAAVKIAYKVYKKLRKAGKVDMKKFKEALKEASTDEIIDFAGDLYTIVDPSSSWKDVIQASFDLFTGFETNNKGNDAVAKALKVKKKKVNPKKVNKNDDEAVSDFVLYEVKDANGNLLKIGKSDSARKRADGTPVRVSDSERKLGDAYPGAKAKITDDLGEMSNAQAKVLEAAKVRRTRSSGEKLPENKERNTVYKKID